MKCQSNSQRGGTNFVKVARASGVDGLNERWAESELCPTISLFDFTGDSRAIVCIVKEKSPPIPYNSSGGGKKEQIHMLKGVAPHHGDVLGWEKEVYCIKSNQSKKSRKPWAKNIAQALSAGCHDSSVVFRRGSKNSEKI